MLAPGTSGSWVVSGSDLHGIIIAGHGQDPVTQMIPIRHLFYNIMTALPAVTSISLPSVTSPVKRKQKQTKAKLSVSEETIAESSELSSPSETNDTTTVLAHLPSNHNPVIQPHALFHRITNYKDSEWPLTKQTVSALVKSIRS